MPPTPPTDTPADEDLVRYAFVGLGWFAQAAILPAFENARENSLLVELVSGDDEKLEELGERYGVPPEGRVGYDGYEELLESGEVDAVYVALPNTSTGSTRCGRRRPGCTCCARSPWR